MELTQAAQATAQVAQQAGGLALLGTALTLGLRHGIDWDHLAAITDITGTAAGATSGTARGAAASAGAAAGGQPGRAPWALAARPADVGAALGRIEWRLVRLASLYALGHALVVVALGLAALSFRAILPAWVDPVMERLVGVTLVGLGFWVVYSLVRYWRGDGELRLRSRWMLVLAGARRGWHALQARLHGRGPRPGLPPRHRSEGRDNRSAGLGHSHAGPAAGDHVHRIDQYGPAAAFGTGLIHGIGAETGTQVLIIAAVGGAATQGLGAAMLLAFVVGLLLSNTAIALLTATGFVAAGRTNSVYVAAGCVAAVFSLWVGSYALLGLSDQLPDLQQAISAVVGEAPA